MAGSIAVPLVLMLLAPVVWELVKYAKAFCDYVVERVSFGEFKKAKVEGVKRKKDRTEVRLYIKIPGEEDLDITGVTVRLRLTTGRDRGLSAWMRLIVGYFTDDIDGLQTVIGTKMPYYLWIPAVPVYRIKWSLLRKGISFLFGLFTAYYAIWWACVNTIIFFLPIPVLAAFWLKDGWFGGPYRELNLEVHHRDITIKGDLGWKDPMPTLESGEGGNKLCLSYSVSECRATGILFGEDFRLPCSYVEKPRVWRPVRLPHRGEFVFLAREDLVLQVEGKARKYRINLGDQARPTFVSIG